MKARKFDDVQRKFARIFSICSVTGKCHIPEDKGVLKTFERYYLKNGIGGSDAGKFDLVDDNEVTHHRRRVK